MKKQEFIENLSNITQETLKKAGANAIFVSSINDKGMIYGAGFTQGNVMDIAQLIKITIEQDELFAMALAIAIEEIATIK